MRLASLGADATKMDIDGEEEEEEEGMGEGEGGGGNCNSSTNNTNNSNTNNVNNNVKAECESGLTQLGDKHRKGQYKLRLLDKATKLFQLFYNQNGIDYNNIVKFDEFLTNVSCFGRMALTVSLAHGRQKGGRNGTGGVKNPELRKISLTATAIAGGLAGVRSKADKVADKANFVQKAQNKLSPTKKAKAVAVKAKAVAVKAAKAVADKAKVAEKAAKVADKAAKVADKAAKEAAKEAAKAAKEQPGKGFWTTSEDTTLKRLVLERGAKNWPEIALELGRSAKQCRERWVNQLDPAISTAAWSEEEVSERASDQVREMGKNQILN